MQRASDTDGGLERMVKELRQIKNLLMLAALKSGATSDEVDYATEMGASNIRRLFPVKRGKRQRSA